MKIKDIGHVVTGKTPSTEIDEYSFGRKCAGASIGMDIRHCSCHLAVNSVGKPVRVSFGWIISLWDA